MEPLDPELATEIERIEDRGVPPWHTLGTAAARRIEDELFTPTDPPPVESTLDAGIDRPAPRTGDGDTTAGESDGTAVGGGAGSSDGEIPIRVYRPGTTPAPVVVFYHGGGWTLGTLDSADDICRRLCRRLDAVVVSVAYRLAPEHPFPAAFEDAVTALDWVDTHGRSVGGNGTVGVAGTSAGGGLAAAVGVAAARDTDPLGPTVETDIAVQLLLYPALAPRFDTDSYETHADGPLLTRADMRSFWATYLRPASTANPYAVPAAATDHTGCPPAVLAVGGHDPLADDTRAYADTLRDSGVPVESFVFPRLAHGFCSFADTVERADEAFDTVAAAARARLGTDHTE